MCDTNDWLRFMRCLMIMFLSCPDIRTRKYVSVCLLARVITYNSDSFWLKNICCVLRKIYLLIRVLDVIFFLV